MATFLIGVIAGVVLYSCFLGWWARKRGLIK